MSRPRYAILNKNNEVVGEFDSGIVYMNDGSYGEYQKGWMKKNGFTAVEIKEDNTNDKN